VTDPFAPPSAGQSWPAPPPAYGGGWSGYPVPEQQPLSTWALVALITGILPLAPIAVVCGIVGLVKTRGGAVRGRGLAIGGLAAAGAWIVAVVALGLIGSSLDGTSGGLIGRLGDAGPTTSAGTCLQLPGDEGSLATVAECSQDHDAEIYANVELGPGQWPGYDTVAERADEVCHHSFQAYVGTSVDDSDFDYSLFVSDEAEWVAGQHAVICVVVPYFDDRLSGSVRDSSQDGVPS
jgi:hypothetical protein